MSDSDDRRHVSAHHGLRSAGIGLGIILAGLALLPLDLIVARYEIPPTISLHLCEVFNLCEVFGQPLGLIFYAWMIYLLVPRDRCRLPRLLAASLGAGLTANLIKLLISRYRPRALDLESSLAGVHDTFHGWLPLLDGGSSVQSLPSAHTAFAVGAATALARYYPQGRTLFAAVAIAVGLQRLLTGAHFVSDVVLGAGVGWLACAACFENRWLRRPFDRWEQGRLELWPTAPEIRVGDRLLQRSASRMSHRMDEQ